MRLTFLYYLLFVFLLQGCVGLETKQEAFPLMYPPHEKPVSMVVVPAINKSTAADAAELINSTLTMPFADNGYYVLPISIVSNIFAREGIIEGSQILGLPAGVFNSNFGADSVLYITINKWDTNYLVLAANVMVGISYVLVSTATEEVLWSYDHQVVVDTAGDSSGFILLDVVKTAVSTAMTDYIPIARQVNSEAVTTLPFGKYHPNVGEDGEIKVVSKKAKDRGISHMAD